MRPHIACLAALVFAVPAAAQWSTPVIDPGVNTPSSEFDPCPTLDGMAMYLSSNRTGNFEIFRSTRSVRYGPFTAATQIMELANTATDYGPCIRIDDCEILFTSSRTGGAGGNDIWRATRASPALPFSAPTPVTELNTTGSESGPSLTADGQTIFFGRGNDIWMAVRSGWTAPFGTPVIVAELNTASIEREPHIASDGLSIFWTTNAGGTNDTWWARRAARNLPFVDVQPLNAVNSAQQDSAPAVAMVADELFFVSDRTGGLGPYDIYTSRFTGLVGTGIAGPGSIMGLRFSDPGSPAFNYLGAAALGTSPGIRFDTRTFPLNADALLGVTIGGLPPVLTGFVGPLDADGVGNGQITFPGLHALVGLRFYTAFVVIDPQAPSGLRTLSNAHEVLIQ